MKRSFKLWQKSVVLYFSNFEQSTFYQASLKKYKASF